jgi:hypothetical protein
MLGSRANTQKSLGSMSTVLLAELPKLSMKRLAECEVPVQDKSRNLESVVLTDLLQRNGWSVDTSWPWRYPNHINV